MSFFLLRWNVYLFIEMFTYSYKQQQLFSFSFFQLTKSHEDETTLPHPPKKTHVKQKSIFFSAATSDSQQRQHLCTCIIVVLKGFEWECFSVMGTRKPWALSTPLPHFSIILSTLVAAHVQGLIFYTLMLFISYWLIHYFVSYRSNNSIMTMFDLVTVEQMSEEEWFTWCLYIWERMWKKCVVSVDS